MTNKRKWVLCPICRGTGGRVVDRHIPGYHGKTSWVRCQRCGGSGSINQESGVKASEHRQLLEKPDFKLPEEHAIEVKNCSVSDIRPGIGYVLIKIRSMREMREVQYGGLTLEVDPSYNQERWVDVKGEVVAVPEIYPKLNKESKIRNTQLAVKGNYFTPTVDIMVGDMIFFIYTVLLNAITYNRVFIIGEEWYALIPFEETYFSFRGERIITHNNWVIVKPVQPKANSEMELGDLGNYNLEKTGGLFIPVKVQEAQKLAEVIACREGAPVSPGDIIYYRRGSDVPFEYELQRTLPDMWRMREDEIVAKFIK